MVIRRFNACDYGALRWENKEIQGTLFEKTK